MKQEHVDWCDEHLSGTQSHRQDGNYAQWILVAVALFLFGVFHFTVGLQ